MNVDQRPISVLSLCSGVGGLDLGVELACPSARVVCYVEREAYADEVLASRMDDEAVAEAAVWTDLTTFDGRAWRGKVDIVTAGFPCQPWSCAGQRKGTADDRWIWPHIAAIIRQVEPGVVFLENVRGLLGGGLGPVLGDLADLGFDAEWCVLPASAVGASHRRERVFVLAHSVRIPGWQWAGRERVQHVDPQVADTTDPSRRRHEPKRRPDGGAAAGRAGEDVGNAASDDQLRDTMSRTHGKGEQTGGPGRPVGDACGEGLQERGCEPRDAGQERAAAERAGSQPLFPPGPDDADAWRVVLDRWPWLAPAVDVAKGSGQSNFRKGDERTNRRRWRDGCAKLGATSDWQGSPVGDETPPEPKLRGLDDGLAAGLDAGRYRADRLRCAGNGVVAIQSAAAFVCLARRAGLTLERGIG